MTLGAGNQAGWSGWWDVPVVSDVDGCEIYQLSVESNHFWRLPSNCEPLNHIPTEHNWQDPVEDKVNTILKLN